MQTRQEKRTVFTTVFLFFAALVAISAVQGQQIQEKEDQIQEEGNQIQEKGEQIPFVPNGVHFPNPGGASQTYSTTGKGIDLTGPFFQSLGGNGRTCGTCHQPSDGMSISTANVQRRFLFTRGQDPIFRTIDGSNCNHSVDVSSLEGKFAAYSLLRTRGLIRIRISVPANADYRIPNVNN